MKSITHEVKVGGVLATGQAGNITYRKTPYATPGDLISGITVTEIGYGIYLAEGFTTWNDDTQCYLSGTKIDSFGVKPTGSIYTSFVNKFNSTMQTITSGLTLAGNLVMAGFKITGLGEGTTAGDSVRYEQVIRTTGTQTGISGVKVFTDLLAYSPSTIPITGDGVLTSKKYVDDLVGGSTGNVQSTYMTKLIPLRGIEDDYAHTTPELCNTYLAALTGISTRTGTVLVESTGNALNTFDVDNHATTQWISAGVWYVGQGCKPILNRKAYNSSLTVSGGIVNCRIKDGATGTPQVASRTYVNFTFQDCEFDVPDKTDITFTTCKFLGINKLKSTAGNAITLTNCTGDAFWYNDTVGATVTITGTSPVDTREVTAANFNW